MMIALTTCEPGFLGCFVLSRQSVKQQGTILYDACLLASCCDDDDLVEIQIRLPLSVRETQLFKPAFAGTNT